MSDYCLAVLVDCSLKIIYVTAVGEMGSPDLGLKLKKHVCYVCLFQATVETMPCKIASLCGYKRLILRQIQRNDS